MELWIRSQDKTKLVKSNYLSLFLSDTKWFIYTDTCGGEPFSIGSYKSKERALEVLEEIQEYLINNSVAKKINGLGETLDLIPISIFVYKMPKE